MKSIARICVGLALLVASRGWAQDQIRWAPDFRTACQLAADQHRLVLLHFYNDNCEPCVRLERNVFSQPHVGEAVAVNYLAVKVHAGKDPQLANRYRVRSWPTDVFVTPTGLEVYRSISPQKPEDYVSLVNQVAQQTGVSASRQWVSKLGEATQPVSAAGAQAANQAAGGVRQATEQAAVTAQDNFIEGQQRWAAALDQFKAASDQARAAASQTTQNFTDGSRQEQQQAQQQVAATGQQWSQQATSAMQGYEQQAGDSYRQFRDQATGASQNVQQQSQQFSQSGRGTAEQLVDAARGSASRWEQTFSQATTPAATTEAAVATTAPAPAVATAPQTPAAEKPATAAPPLLPTENPWMAARQQETSKPTPTIEATPPERPATSAPPLLPQTTVTTTVETSQPPVLPPPTTPYEPPAAPQVAAVPPPTQPQVATPAGRPPTPAFGPGQLVPASQAPPIAMDGFCPVTLLETVTRDPHDRAAWKKGNPKFGAIHRGRTYMFTSPEQQQKFLANPDAYAPVLSGCDPVAFAERGELLDGKRAYGLITPDKRIFLFADEGALRKFNQSPGSYAAAAQQAMLRSDTGAMYR